MDWIQDASLTSPQGYAADAAVCGIKTYGDEPRYDLGLLVSERPASAAGIFTTNRICGAPVTVNRTRIPSAETRVLVINSGCSNVAMGARGLEDAKTMARWAGEHVGVPEAAVLVGSTGVIGRPLPMEKLRAGLALLRPSAEGGARFARAMMTTDTVPKSRGVSLVIDGKRYVVAGSAKGSGMSHPNMATVFCFLTTDAAVAPDWLQGAVKRVGDETINMVDVDMDTSTSDMMIALANGAAGGPQLSATGLEQLESAMRAVALELAKDLARDGEGARALIEAHVTGAKSVGDARLAARTVVSSPLIKTMVTGRDPNLGRVLMAVGRSGAELDEGRLSVAIGSVAAFEKGAPTAVSYDAISHAMDGEEVLISVDLGVGDAEARAWGCDLTEDYVRINADYTT